MTMVRQRFSTTWNRSIQPRKQRKYRFNAPLHLKQKQVHAHLSPELRKKFNVRHVQVRVGDKARIMRGGFKKKEGRVERISLKKMKVYVLGVEYVKRDGSKVPLGIDPSAVMITELDLKDVRRKKALEKHALQRGTKATDESKKISRKGAKNLATVKNEKGEIVP